MIITNQTKINKNIVLNLFLLNFVGVRPFLLHVYFCKTFSGAASIVSNKVMTRNHRVNINVDESEIQECLCETIFMFNAWYSNDYQILNAEKENGLFSQFIN